MTEMRLTLRLDANGTPLLGHGKIRLLEQIGRTGSISAAARVMGMSYRRAWLLVEAMNTAFTQPLVSARPGGGGGAGLSPQGEAVLRLYREIEDAARDATRAPLEALGAMCAPAP
ncbi:winged helix-turn-helix domain-containing protein [Komagataeibacter sp. FNDCR2]|uniref:winged helix-turn-helix domain-containing protein n=1 Tax=Komagataeibacter sp. FNDCR2 TaxID=2878682 RepID=UPI001E2966A5|nr:LysR family transcriptional regulator [Komagataeibacter sp. FNDCR2]MCE2575953.1 LysR family transcriptional regulator [Komagataeibacter sp. FNDCR2]